MHHAAYCADLALSRPETMVYSARLWLPCQTEQVPSACHSHTFHRVPVIESFDKTDGVRQRSAGHEYVHDLVAGAIDVEGPGIPFLRQASGVDGGARAVQETQTQEVGDGHASILLFPAIEDDAVDDGDESRESEESEHGGSHDAVGGTSELGLHC